MDQILEAVGGRAMAPTSLLLERYRPPVAVDSTNFLALARNLKEVGLCKTYFREDTFPYHMGCLAGVTKLALVDVVLEGCNSEEPLGLSELGDLEVLQLRLIDFEGVGAIHQVLGGLAGLRKLRDLTLDLRPELSSELVTGDDMVLGDVHLWQLLPLCSTLTRLVLGDAKGYGTLRNIKGPGLAVVGRLTCLRQLELGDLAVLASPCLDGFLLPLPASLRRLELRSDAVVPGVLARLQAAARGQDCAVRVGRWV
jgi:hypothetical protein